MNSGNGGGGAGGAGGLGMMGMRASPFTVSQWQELEHQALIFKYMVAGLPVPPDLVLPIQKSFESISHRFFHHPTMGYCSFYGKKVDPEPGRCRRTDGKKWRCSKDAYPDSKYCERHMHRGRNRSRKPVESQTITQSSSTVTSLTATGSSGGTGSYQNLPLHAFGNPQGTTSGTNQSHYHVDSISCGIPNKDYRPDYLHCMDFNLLGALHLLCDMNLLLAAIPGVRSIVGPMMMKLYGKNKFVDIGHVLTYIVQKLSKFLFCSAQNNFSTIVIALCKTTPCVRYLQVQGLKPEVGEHSFFTEASGSNRGLQMDSPIDSAWPLMQSRVSSHPQSKSSNTSILQNDYPQHSFFNSEFTSGEPVKQEGQSLRPFFDEWPKTRDSWSGLEDERSHQTSFSTTKLSISIPMASSDLSATSSRSPHGSGHEIKRNLAGAHD
ncbi:hypothetical protein WN944_019626 [Citrus x changshan-huyou]|uniref:Growth-regulating factor n=1 Tax=Citrus x changshan-huyou TaxID=2935761 RepID=A0AAP0QFB3_9ROSI